MGEMFQQGYDQTDRITANSAANSSATFTTLDEELKSLIEKMAPDAITLGLSLTVCSNAPRQNHVIALTSISDQAVHKSYPLTFKGVYDAGYYLMEERCRQDLIRRLPDVIKAGWYICLDVPNPEYPRTRGFFLCRKDDTFGKFYLYKPDCVESALAELPRPASWLDPSSIT